MIWPLKIISQKLPRCIQFLSGAQVSQSQTNTIRHKVKRMKYLHHMKISTMMKKLKMEKRKKSSKKRHMEMSTHQTGKITKVMTSLKTKTKITKKTPPLKITAQKNG